MVMPPRKKGHMDCSLSQKGGLKLPIEIGVELILLKILKESQYHSLVNSRGGSTFVFAVVRAWERIFVHGKWGGDACLRTNNQAYPVRNILLC